MIRVAIITKESDITRESIKVCSVDTILYEPDFVYYNDGKENHIGRITLDGDEVISVSNKLKKTLVKVQILRALKLHKTHYLYILVEEKEVTHITCLMDDMYNVEEDM